MSEAAYALEMAGKREDLALINKLNPEFVSALESLLKKINDVVISHKVNTETNKTPLNMEVLKSELVKLKAEIEDMNAGAIDRTILTLQKSSCTGDIAAAIENISKHILMAEYDEASSIVEKLLENLKSL